MMPDRPPDAASDLRINEFTARFSNAIGRYKLSPPYYLRAAVESWVRQGLTADEAIEFLHRHMDLNRRLYTCGSGDQFFAILRADIAKALQAKHPRPQIAEPERPARARRRVVPVHNASGRPDVIVDDPAAPIPRTRAAPVAGPSSLPGYEREGAPITSIEDDDADI